MPTSKTSKSFMVSAALGALVFGIIGAYAGTLTADRMAADLTPKSMSQNHSWLFSDRIGSASASSLTRARAVRTGTLALSPSEAVYFFTDRDSGGDILLGDCHYQISGGDVEARWWSIAVYGEDYLYIPNAKNRSSFNSRNITRDSDRTNSETWTINLSREQNALNWIPSGEARQLEVLYRIYRPSEELRKQLPRIPLPRVEKVSCS